MIGVSGRFVIAPNGVYDETASIALVQQIVQNCKARGFTTIRYQSTPSLLNQATYHQIKYPVLDALIAYAGVAGIHVRIDPIHNFPASSTSLTLQSRWNDVVGLLLYVGGRYNNTPNTTMELLNEYTLDDFRTKVSALITTLRNAGITMPLSVNCWWAGTKSYMNPFPEDPTVKIGHHHYFDRDVDNSPRYADENFASYCVRLGIDNIMRNYFEAITDPTYYGYGMAHGAKIACTEVGGSNLHVQSFANVAYVMRFIQFAEQYGVDVEIFRDGTATGEDKSDIAAYYQTAKQIGMNFYPVYDIVVEKKSLLILGGDYGTTSIPPGSYSYDKGTQVSITALPDEGYKFDHWICSSSGEPLLVNPLTLQMDIDITLQPVFILKELPKPKGWIEMLLLGMGGVAGIAIYKKNRKKLQP